MARVNHKLVKKLLNEQRSKITDKQFFTSRTLAGHFEDMAAAQTRRYHYNRRVRVQLAWNPEASGSANTNNEVININAGHTMVTQEKGRQNRYQMVCGLFAHELGHVLYTDFLALQTQMNYLERGLWYPGPPALRTSAEFANEKALWAYIKADPKNQEAVKSVSYNILNVLEDGYVENRMLAEFPGTLGFALETMRMGQLKGMSTVTQMKEAEEDGRFHILDSILLAMLGYVKYGEIDESGSMWCADRATYARAAAIILHDFCEGLEIPVMVYGHSTGRSSHGNTVEMYSYAEFEGFDRDDKYRLMDISARDSNRDGAALRYVAEKLSARPEAVKLLILVSDGQPADLGYSGTAAEEDLRGIKQEYQRKGVIFVAAAIGDDKPNIKRIYGDSFLDITDLEKLPAKLTAVVKKHIRI